MSCTGGTTTFPFEEAVETLRTRCGRPPELLLVLGSGLAALAEGAANVVSVPFREVPGFPGAGVEGHPGRYVFGEMEGRWVLFQVGRFHCYEGHTADLVTAPVRLAASLGARTVILTNAAGGIAPHLEPGSLMLLGDHLNFMGRSSLAGLVLGEEAQFPGLAAPYDPAYLTRALELADDLGISLFRGVYAAVVGPSYETPAEVRFLARAGAHAVGMSTVPEAIAAAKLGLRVLGISLITNRAAGLGSGILNHREVLETGRVASGKMERLLRAFIRELPIRKG